MSSGFSSDKKFSWRVGLGRDNNAAVLCSAAMGFSFKLNNIDMESSAAPIAILP